MKLKLRTTQINDSRRARAVAEHVLMSRLYREDTRKFEAERRRKIDALIATFGPAQQARLRAYQATWDQILVPEFKVD
ncbi:MAG TPA: hypothetical protein DHV36_17120 [Desulfobacteraceae bacterium]|nr:hypothetical protein [Desulfobacteraceae bacterium]|tara:strand:- start:507 stop:740 length:234 start_codon:yes stop_codon:yes gene_type:complete